MNSTEIEHYCTLFDSVFLPQGLCLYESLCRHAQPFRLWVLCMDERVERGLQALNLPNLSAIPLRDFEDVRLLAVKPSRSRGEYCWTLTPFIFDAVLRRAPEAARVTYLDADLYFFSPPMALHEEFRTSGKDVLLTEHAYAPEYDQSKKSGRFCVQFLTFRATPGAERVRKWWQDRCLEWCYARFEDGKFGDQKYLDAWPKMFDNEIHIVRQSNLTMAPWNAKHLMKQGYGTPVFYHFHGLRRITRFQWMLYLIYEPGGQARKLYDEYCESLSRSLRLLQNARIESVTPAGKSLIFNTGKMIVNNILRRATYRTIRPT